MSCEGAQKSRWEVEPSLLPSLPPSLPALSCLSKQCLFCLPEWQEVKIWPECCLVGCFLLPGFPHKVYCLLFYSLTLPAPMPQEGANIPRKNKLTSQNPNLIMEHRHSNRNISSSGSALLGAGTRTWWGQEKGILNCSILLRSHLCPSQDLSLSFHKQEAEAQSHELSGIPKIAGVLTQTWALGEDHQSLPDCMSLAKPRHISDL